MNAIIKNLSEDLEREKLERHSEVDEMKKERDKLLCQCSNQREEISLLTTAIEQLNNDKTELQQLAQKEKDELRRQLVLLQETLSIKEENHSKSLQEAQKKYEEHLLQITRISTMNGNPDRIVDMYRKKLFNQK